MLPVQIHIKFSQSKLILNGPKWARAQGPNEWAQMGPGPNEWARAQQGPNESPRMGPNGPGPGPNEWAQMGPGPSPNEWAQWARA